MQNWDTDSLFMVACAVKAPSGHNTQPWRFTIEKGVITIHPDLDKRLPIVDADNRELFISLGCAAENLCLAASKLQYLWKLEIAHNGSIAVRLNHAKTAPSASDNLLFDYINQRQTNRSIYSGKEIPEDILQNILKEFEKEKFHNIHAWPRTNPKFNQLAQYVMEGNVVQMNDDAFRKELLSWIRFNRKHAQRTCDGLSYAALEAPSLPAWISRPIVKLMLNHKKQNASDLKKIYSSSHLVLLTSQENTIPAWIETGRILQRLLLRLTQAGIAHAYLNQPCEVPTLHRKLRVELLGHSAFAQILLRIGYSKQLPHSLRKSVQSVIQCQT